MDKLHLFKCDTPLWEHVDNTEPSPHIFLQGTLRKNHKKLHSFRVDELNLIQLKAELPHKYIRLVSATLTKTSTTEFILSKDGESTTFTATNKDTCDDWYDVIKERVIWDDFDSKFKLCSYLGQGSFGQVYSIQDRISGEHMAAKMFVKENMAPIDAQALAKEIQIAHILKRIPNTIRIQYLFENQYAVIFVAGLLYGGSLAMYLKDHTLTEVQVAQVVYNLLKTLQYLLRLNIIHRDIKNDNIILREPNDLSNIVLCDYGLADFHNPKGKYLFRKCGTPGYSAPELLSNKKYDHKADLYSVGCVMFRLISGRSPFKGDNFQDLYLYNQYGIVNYEGLQAGSALDLLKQLLQEDPSKRISIEDALKHKFFQILPRKPRSS